MDALDLWDRLANCNWAVRVRGYATPFFCTVLKTPPQDPVKVRFLMLEGWQTLHDFIRAQIDPSAGSYSSPMEIRHYELALLRTGEGSVFRHEPCYMPRKVNERESELCAKLLWQAYGVMMRLETETQLPMKYADENAIFARVETDPDVWEDQPLVIVQPQPYTEKVAFDKAMLAKAKDLPILTGVAYAVDFRLLVKIMTKEPRPRTVYELTIRDEKGAVLVAERVSPVPEAGLKALWESVPPRILAKFVEFGRVPGELRMTSKRLFRFLRPLMLDLSVRLSLHDR